MFQRTVVPTFTVRNAGLNTNPGVNTSTVVVPGSLIGCVGELSPPHAERRAHVTPANISDRMVKPLRVGFPWKTFVAMGMLWLGACASESATGPSTPATPEGSFSLSMIDTKALPYSMFADTGYALDVMSGSLSITPDRKWVSRMTTRETVAGNVSTYSDSAFGTWSTVQGSTSASLLNAETNVISTATWTISDITVTDVTNGVTRRILYRRN